jgi:methylenetetrahydrofolate--tRNA-(uracil-5-)-methyltransferase
MIPALKNAEFLRYGVMHRNSYLDAPRVLNADFSFKDNRRLFFAGQITGVEGYVESAASGLLAALHLADGLENISRALDDKTVCGALEKHISTPQKDFEPMNANFGILSPMPVRIRDKKERYRALAERALQTIRAFKQQDKE